MDNPKTAILERLKTANTVLVTVSKNPTVDQLAALIGLTLVINKMNKHGSAVFSGVVPSTIEFLRPKETIETNTDSLRDFIISLDRSKADKLRYKVEDKVVKIFITPYRTSLSENDLNFSQGDFNVELVIGLGVKEQKDLDEAITSHGRILHDATVSTINTVGQGSMGSINWIDPQASSLSELVYDLAKAAGDNLVNDQVATALLTGIVAETNRFSNNKTSPRTMAVAGELMAAGADQQLVTSSLKETNVVAPNPNVAANTINITHQEQGTIEEKVNKVLQPSPNFKPEPNISSQVPPANLPQPANLPAPVFEDSINKLKSEINNAAAISQDMVPQKTDNGYRDPDLYVGPDSKFMTQAPINESILTANSKPEGYDPSTDPLTNLTVSSNEEKGFISNPKTTIQPDQNFTAPPDNWKPPVDTTQLNDQNQTSVNDTAPASKDSHIDTARNMVDKVLSSENITNPEPIKALNAMPLGNDLHNTTVNTIPAPINITSVPPVPPPIPMNTDNPSK